MATLSHSRLRTDRHTNGHGPTNDQFPADFLANIESAVLAREGRRRSVEITFRCPLEGHDDRHPSARWNTQKAVWTCDVCKVGGGALDLADRVGVPKPAGRRERRVRASRRIVATYDYRDASGKLLFQVVRNDPKGFYQRRPGDHGGWKNGLGGIEPVLYRLREALHTDEMIVLVEGEKDVDRLHGLGLVATTNPMGAGKWRASYTKMLAGREVAILPDNDEPGRRHAHEVAAKLHPAGGEVRVVTLSGLPAKGDVSDWLDHGNSVDDLAQLIADTPLWEAPALSRDSHRDNGDDPSGLSLVTPPLWGVTVTVGVATRKMTTRSLSNPSPSC